MRVAPCSNCHVDDSRALDSVVLPEESLVFLRSLELFLSLPSGGKGFYSKQTVHALKMFARMRRQRSAFDKSPHVLRTLHQQFIDSGIESNKTPTKKGVLHKLSRTSKLQARYFKLCDHYLLYYSENVDEANHDKILSRPSGYLDLHDYSEVIRTDLVTLK